VHPRVDDVRLALLLVIFARGIALLLRAIWGPTLARVVNPAHDVIVARLFADARQVRGEVAADLLPALVNRVAGHAAFRLEQLLAVPRVALVLPRHLSVERRLP